MRKECIYEAILNDIMNASISENYKNKMLKNVMRLKAQKMNIMITGATGCGKSSTINAIFGTEVAEVGFGVDPETMGIRKYELDNLVLWDTPGLDDGKEADNRYTKNIIKKLLEVDKNTFDLVLVILDGGRGDLGISYELINKAIIPNLGKGKENRILVAINQADTAMKGYNWDRDKNEPNQKLVKFLEEKVRSVRDRVYEATGVTIEPIYYSAGYKDEEREQSRPYNLSKLLYYIVKATPSEKRAIYVNNINENREMWRDDDKLLDYGEATRKSIFESIREGASAGAGIGGAIGGAIDGILGSEGESIFRGVGEAIGGIIGGIIGFFF